MAYSVFVTYNFEGSPYSGGTSIGINESIHCNYIQKLETDTLAGKDLNLYFDLNAFPFLNPLSGGATTGWTATKINAIVQVVPFTGETATTDPSQWKVIDITNQLVGTSGNCITQTELEDTVFKLTFAQINAAPLYDLTYLDNPSSVVGDDNRLALVKKPSSMEMLRPI
ncbi:MAG: hypothetical protein HC836_15610 [Richelia sp. RM2_1_2]|nr:hypothetical protein [Richelia sp. RM2_1_2]